MEKVETKYEVKVGDTIRNTVGILLFVRQIDNENKIIYLANSHNDINPYRLERVYENIKSGKWTHQPLRKYANWI